MITILDYGMGNLRSVEKAIQRVGGDCKISSDFEGCEKLVIPGVGAFGAAMERLRPMRDKIRAFAQSGRPVLGICLGQQLLFESSEEMGVTEGLGLIEGTVRYLPRDLGLKVPNIGWSSLAVAQHGGLFADTQEGDQVYFVHSLYTECKNAEDVAATATYGIPFAAAIQRANIWGTQFHPEKSGSVGLRMLNRFVIC